MHLKFRCYFFISQGLAKSHPLGLVKFAIQSYLPANFNFTLGPKLFWASQNLTKIDQSQAQYTFRAYIHNCKKIFKCKISFLTNDQDFVNFFRNGQNLKNEMHLMCSRAPSSGDNNNNDEHKQLQAIKNPKCTKSATTTNNRMFKNQKC